VWSLLIEDEAGNVREWHNGTWNGCVTRSYRLPANGWTVHSIVKMPSPQALSDEYVTLDSVLSHGRHEEDSGVDLGRMPK
jgi:hypothetical protein